MRCNTVLPVKTKELCQNKRRIALVIICMAQVTSLVTSSSRETYSRATIRMDRIVSYRRRYFNVGNARDWPVVLALLLASTTILQKEGRSKQICTANGRICLFVCDFIRWTTYCLISAICRKFGNK